MDVFFKINKCAFLKVTLYKHYIHKQFNKEGYLGKLLTKGDSGWVIKITTFIIFVCNVID